MTILEKVRQKRNLPEPKETIAAPKMKVPSQVTQSIIVHRKSVSVDDARKQLWSEIEDGVICPVCDQLAKKWQIKLHSGMAYWLLLLVRQYSIEGDWISVRELNHRAGMRGGDYAKLKHWNLIVQATSDDVSKRASGYWKPTQLGIDFVNLKCTVPRGIWTYDGKLQGFTVEQTTIMEALGDKFDYEELMEGK